MKQFVVKALLALNVCLLTAVAPPPAQASDWPMIQGDYWEIVGIHIKDGGSLTYVNFLAKEWKADQDFAKSKGWIKSYTVLTNAYPRKGEPDLYLVVITDHVASGPESEKRNDEYMAWRKKTEAQMQKESGDRVEVRELGSNLLLQELKFK